MGGSSGGGRSRSNNNPAPVQVPVPSAAGTTAMAANTVTGMSRSASNANVFDQQNSLSAVADFLRTGGTGIINPGIRDSISLFNTQTDKQLAPLRKTANDATLAIAKLRAELSNPNLNPKRRAQIENKLIPAQQKKLDTASASIDAINAARTSYESEQNQGQPNFRDLIAETFPEAQQAMERSQPYLENMGRLGAAGERLQGALGQGFQANTIGSRSTQAVGSGMGTNVTAQNVGLGGLGNTLMGRALNFANSQGQLSDQATRDAIQSARQGLAARGLATGSSALAAELLNRDRYANQRMFREMEFARQFQTDDVDRQMKNAANALQADMANQSDLTARQTFDAGQANSVNIANANRELQADTANEEARRLGNQMNVGMLNDAYNLQQGVNEAGLRAVGLGQTLAAAANPNTTALNMFMSSGNATGSQALPGAASVTGSYLAAANDANAFNANSALWQRSANTVGNYGPMQSGGGVNVPGLIGGGVGATAAFATGNPTLAPAAFNLGYGVGSSFNR